MTDDPDALMALILNDPDATPEDVKGAADSGAVTQAHARAWLVGYLAPASAPPPHRPPGFAAVLVKLRDRSLADPRIPPVHTAGCPSVGTPAGSRDRAAIWRAWPCGR